MRLHICATLYLYTRGRYFIEKVFRFANGRNKCTTVKGVYMTDGRPDESQSRNY